MERTFDGQLIALNEFAKVLHLGVLLFELRLVLSELWVNRRV
jgi:hypothetical protein